MRNLVMKQLNIKALAENIKCRAESDIKENNICGASIAVISTDETLYKAHFGTLSAEDKSPLNDRALFRIASMTKPHFENAINGGPLTLEFHESLFADDESVEKVGMLVKNFIDRGGHQLQLNTVNREKMLDAQAHPENYKQLVVRIWGWSAYFVELDKEYQDHVIARQAYSV